MKEVDIETLSCASQYPEIAVKMLDLLADSLTRSQWLQLREDAQHIVDMRLDMDRRIQEYENCEADEKRKRKANGYSGNS